MIKELLNKGSILSSIRNLNREPAKRHPLQNISSDTRYKLIHLGTDYGGWTFVDCPSLTGVVVISAGLGEDASFDVEFASKYNARMIIIDPTPRAINHYDQLCSRLGKPRITEYVKGGKQPIDSYHLTNITTKQLTIEKRALWSDAEKIKLYQPKNPNHVSYSINRLLHGHVVDNPYIEVDACPLRDVLAKYKIDKNNLELIKLDIEGAEVEVIESMLGDDIFPKQICVEFDNLNLQSDESYKLVDKSNNLLEKNGYKCIHTDGKADFLYVRTAEFSV